MIERLVYSPDGLLVAAFRECRWCGEEIELDGQPTDDPRVVCDRDCFLAECALL